jgi:hypothetical protein
LPWKETTVSSLPNKKEPYLLTTGYGPSEYRTSGNRSDGTPYAGMIQFRFKGYLLSLRGTPGCIELFVSVYPDPFTKSSVFFDKNFLPAAEGNREIGDVHKFIT